MLLGKAECHTKQSHIAAGDQALFKSTFYSMTSIVELSHAHLALPSVLSIACVCCIGKVRFPTHNHGISWLDVLLQRFPTLYITAEHSFHAIFERTEFRPFSISLKVLSSTGLIFNSLQ